MDQSLLIDLRTIVGEPYGDLAIKIPCLMHDDPQSSLAVYDDHLYCYGCQRFVRRFAGAALLLGTWDGDPATEKAAAIAIQPRLKNFKPARVHTSRKQRDTQVDSSLPKQFMRYLLYDSSVLEYFQEWRGYSVDIIRQFELGYTGTHFTIPVRGVEGDLRAIRFRLDPRLHDTGDGSKYEGFYGKNEAQLFSLPSFRGISEISDLWITEGEYDKIATVQLAGGRSDTFAVTLTNGAGRLNRFLEAWATLGIAVRRYVIATDQDEPGEEACHELCRQLPVLSTVRARWQAGKDMNEYLLAGGDLASVRLLQRRR